MKCTRHVVIAWVKFRVGMDDESHVSLRGSACADTVGGSG